MGRQQFLTRLALGRSPFEDIEEDQATSQNVPEISTPHVNKNGLDVYVQQYTNKGRPINPRIEAFKASLRAAQNEALALVGVVERKDSLERQEEIRQKYIREERAALLVEENERGELLDFVLTPVRFLSRLWVEAFVQRIQIGFYNPARSMSEVLFSEWKGMLTAPWRYRLATLFPALSDILAHVLVRIPLHVLAEQLTGRLQVLVQKRHFSDRKTKHNLHYAISILFEALLLGIDILILPIEYYAFAQRLHLAPALPLFPPLRFILPGTADCFHSTLGWKPLVNYSLIKTLTSPAFLLLAYKIFHYDEDNEEDMPICSLFTSYRYPKINADPKPINPPKLLTDPFGYILHKGYLLRTSLLRICGWNLIKEPRQIENEENTLPPTRHPPLQSRHGQRPTYRSTHLAHMPAQNLANMIDRIYSHILILPFESLMLRTIAATYLSSTLPKTPAALFASPRIYQPFTTPLPLDWTYLSRLGLSLALSTTIETSLFFTTYTLTRHVGRTFYDWGTKNKNIGFAGVIFGNVRSHSSVQVIEDVEPLAPPPR